MAAANRSTRRWRLARVKEQLPGFISSLPDGDGCNKDDTTVVIEFSGILSAIARGSKAAVKHVAEWSPECKSLLVLAVSGGQWPQARRAAVRK